MPSMERVGAFALGWGESLLWDERRQRLYFVDCATQQLLWLDAGDESPTALAAPTMPAGIVATEDGRIVAALDDGLHVVDPDVGTWQLVSPYPEGLGARANDMCADLDGNLITGTLNLTPGAGSAWWFSATEGWRLIDDDITNTNGPAVAVLDGAMTLIVGDTAAHYYRYPYEPATGAVGARTIVGDVTDLAGGPDGSTLDAAGGLWCALFGGGQLVRFTSRGLDRVLPVPMANPTDVTFGGPDLDRLYVVSVGGEGELDGALVVVDGLGPGRVEPRARLDGVA
jgi:sugar lactone lactonase YvrE